MRELTLAIQYLLRASGANVRADGILGPKTEGALVAAPKSVQQTVQTMRSTVAALPVPVDPAFISDQALSPLVQRAASVTGSTISYLELSLRIENFRDSGRGGFRTVLTGSHRGLGQFDEVTWNSISRVGDVGVYPSVADPNHAGSVLAMGYLYLENKRVFLAAFPDGKFTDEVAYLYHNQGSTQATNFLRSGKLSYPSQSREAIRVMQIARASYAGKSANFA